MQASITGLGFGSDSSHAGGVTKSGINTQNIEITDHTGQLQRTGNSAQTALDGIRTDITTETAQAHSGSVTNQFDKDALQKELDIQRTTTETFGKNAAQAVALTAETLGKVKEYQVIEHQKVLAEQALNQETDPGKRAELTRTIDLAEDYLKTHKAEYETWKEGGVGRVALHTVAGGLLTGNN